MSTYTSSGQQFPDSVRHSIWRVFPITSEVSVLALSTASRKLSLSNKIHVINCTAILYSWKIWFSKITLSLLERHAGSDQVQKAFSFFSILENNFLHSYNSQQCSYVAQLLSSLLNKSPSFWKVMILTFCSSCLSSSHLHAYSFPQETEWNHVIHIFNFSTKLNVTI